MASLNPAIHITLEELKGEDKITYPKQLEEMSNRERLKFEKRKEKLEDNIARKKKFKANQSDQPSDGKSETTSAVQ